MKDFRSLEHKIRDMQIAEAEARNTALRKKVVNVGRPDTAEDPVDVKSKLAKQGEIKTKIIDEADEAKKAGEFHFGNPDDLHAHLKKAHADKNQDSVHRAIKGAPTHSLQKLHAKLKPQDGERQQHRDKELFHLSIGGELKRRGVKEEVEQIDEKNWIAGAIKHKGALHKQLHVPADEPIPAEKLNAAAEKGGKLGKRARLAKTLKRIVKGK